MSRWLRNRRKPYYGPDYELRRWVLMGLLVLMIVVGMAYGLDYLFPGPIPESR